MTSPSKSGAVVVDANILISLCAKEPTFATADNSITDYALRGWAAYNPHVIVAEVLYVLCLKHQSGLLTVAAYDDAVKNLQDQMQAILPPPQGDAALIKRATEIRSGYGCSHSTDGLYIALVEELSKTGSAEFLTFDKGAVTQIKKNAPTVTVNLLPI